MADKYDKLDRMRADIQKDRDKVTELLERIKQKEARLKEAEASQIVADVGALNMSPEQLGEFLALIQSGQLSAMLNGNVPVASQTSNYSADSTSTYNTSDDEDEILEDIEDEDN